MQLVFRHRELRADAIETQFSVRTLERQRMRDRRFFAVEKPFVHAPEMGGFQREPEFVHDPRNERELFRGSDRAANADWIIGRRLPPGRDVFERFGEIEIFQRIIENDLESVPGKSRHRRRRKAGSFFDQRVVERGVVPPIRGNSTEFSGHGCEGVL